MLRRTLLWLLTALAFALAGFVGGPWYASTHANPLAWDAQVVTDGKADGSPSAPEARRPPELPVPSVQVAPTPAQELPPLAPLEQAQADEPPQTDTAPPQSSETAPQTDDTSGGTQTLPPVTGGAQPLTALNDVRALAGLPPVARNADWEGQCAAHAAYLVRADTGEHREDPASPYRTPAGEVCAPGHYFVSSRADSGAERALAYWASGPFHLPQLLDPRLKTSALAVSHDASGGVQTAAVLDVARGRAGAAAYPVRFPGPQAVSPLTAGAASEWPDPLPGCPGYAQPVGAPVALLLGGGGKAVTGAALKVNGQAVAACLLTAQTFTGGADGDTRAGRGVLAAQGAAVLLPRQPLPQGATVKVSFWGSGVREGWTFKVR